MKLVKESKGISPEWVIISGDGCRDFNVLKRISQEFDGETRVLWFPKKSITRRSGLSALDSIKTLASKYGLESVIYIVDGEHINGEPVSEIQEYLQSIAIQSDAFQPIQNAHLVNCSFGSHHIILYCIIAGPETFIEEGIVHLIELILRVSIDLSGERTAEWREVKKSEINRTLRDRGLNIKKLLQRAGRNQLMQAFPSIYAVLRHIEENYRN